MTSTKWHWHKTLNVIFIASMCFTRSITSAEENTNQNQIQSQIEAAYIYQMAKFVNWPIAEQQQLNFCFFASNDQHSVNNVLTTLQGKGDLTVQNHIVSITILDNNISTANSPQAAAEPNDINNFNSNDLERQLTNQLSNQYNHCSLIYFSNEKTGIIDKDTLMELSRNKLTIGTSQSFMDNGGLSAIVAEKGKLRLYINRSLYENGNVRIRSRLLKLARFYPQ